MSAACYSARLVRRVGLLVSALAILVWAVLYVAPGLRPGYVLLPLDLLSDLDAWKPDPAVRSPVSNHLLSDTVLQMRPWNEHARRSFAEGRIPWTNPHQGYGEVFVANPQTALLSPFSWLTLLFPDAGWALAALLKLAVAALGARAFALVMGASGRAALVSGLVYAGSGWLVVWALYPSDGVAAFLPWLGASLLHLAREPSPRRVLAVVGSAAGATAGGHPETLFAGVVGIAAFLFWQACRERPRGRRTAARLALASASAACGFLLLSVIVVPFLLVLSRSPVRETRVSRPTEPFRAAAAVSQLFPGFLGTPLRDEIDLSLLHPRGENFNERSSTYVGAIVLLALVVSFRGLSPSFRRAAVIAAVALLAAWRTPPLAWVIHHLPGFSMMASGRLAIVFVLFASAASGPALEALEGMKPRRLLGAALLAGGLSLALLGAAPSVPRLRPPLRAAALDGIERLRSRGALPHARSVYEARLEAYLANGAWTALRRASMPGLAIALAGVALLSVRHRGLLTAAALVELLAFGLGYLPAVKRSAEPGPPPALVDLMRLDPGREFAFASFQSIFPPDLATTYGLRDIAAYDALGVSPAAPLLAASGYDADMRTFPAPMSPEAVARLAANGVRWFLSRTPVSGAIPAGGAPPPGVGLYEREDATRPPPSPDVPPAGLAAGIVLSLAALFSVPLLCFVSRLPSSTATPP